MLSKLLLFVLSFTGTTTGVGTTPVVGEKAPDFTLVSTRGGEVRLSEWTGKSRVVLVVLRGYPGYQCPYCNLQVQDFLKRAEDFARAGVHVILVYPGPGEKLNERAKEFLVNKELPGHFDLVLDPDYSFTNLYGLRWDAPKETAYPATFLLDKAGKVLYSKVSKSHGGRASAAELLDVLAKVSG